MFGPMHRMLLFLFLLVTTQGNGSAVGLPNARTLVNRSSTNVKVGLLNITRSKSMDLVRGRGLTDAILSSPPVVYARSVSKFCEHVVARTTLYDHRCFNTTPKILRQLLVTGSGGCGTHHAIDLFKTVGVKLSHETIGSDGSASWTYAINDIMARGWHKMWPSLTSNIHKDGYVWGRLSEQKSLPKITTLVDHIIEPRFHYVFHQVRCPLENIDALLTHGKESAAFIAAAFNLGKFLPSKECFAGTHRKGVDLKTLTELEECDVHWAMLVYYRWNLFIESFSSYRYRIETVDVKDLATRAGFTYQMTESKKKSSSKSKSKASKSTKSTSSSKSSTGHQCGSARFATNAHANHHYSPVSIRCSSGKHVDKVVFADWGLAKGVCGSFRHNPACSEHNITKTFVESKCLGKSSCVVDAVHDSPVPDPCPGMHKVLNIEVSCSSKSSTSPRRQLGQAKTPGNHRNHIGISPADMKSHNATLAKLIETMAKRYGYAWASDTATNCTLL